MSDGIRGDVDGLKIKDAVVFAGCSSRRSVAFSQDSYGWMFFAGGPLQRGVRPIESQLVKSTT